MTVAEYQKYVLLQAHRGDKKSLKNRESLRYLIHAALNQLARGNLYTLNAIVLVKLSQVDQLKYLKDAIEMEPVTFYEKVHTLMKEPY